MSAVAKPKPAARGEHHGPLDWRHLVEWLSHDGLISTEEAKRTVARCSQAESAQHPLVRLAAVAMTRAADGKPLDIETLTQWLAGRAGLDYLRIDPLKVDVGKVADTMSAFAPFVIAAWIAGICDAAVACVPLVSLPCSFSAFSAASAPPDFTLSEVVKYGLPRFLGMT